LQKKITKNLIPKEEILVKLDEMYYYTQSKNTMDLENILPHNWTVY